MPGAVEIRDEDGELVARVEPDARDLLIERSSNLQDVSVDLRPLSGHRNLRRIVVRCVEDQMGVGSADLPDRLDALRWLEVRSRIGNPGVIQNLTSLRMLEAGRFSIPSLAPLAALTELERLGVADPYRPAIDDQHWFPVMPRLDTLRLEGRLDHRLEALAAALPALKTLVVNAIPIPLFAGVGALEQVERLALWTDSTATTPYKRLPRLRSLWIRQPLRSLAFLADLGLDELRLFAAVRDQALLALPDSLRTLVLSSRRLRKLDWLVRVPHLRELCFTHCAGLADLRPLARLQDLEVLEFFGASGLEHAAVLAELPQLRRLSLSPHALADPDELAWLARLRPDLDIGSQLLPEESALRRPLPGLDLG